MHKRKLDESMSDHAQICKLPKIDIPSEGCPLRYDFMTSLENIALAKICIHLWSSQQVQHEIVDMFHKNPGENFDNFVRINNCVVSKVSKLPLPKSVVQKLREITPHIGDSVFSWMDYLDHCVFQTTRKSEYSAVDQINNIAWTTRGKIDQLQTAKNILGHPCNFLSKDHKYKLACCYCLEDEIAFLAANVVGPDYLQNVYFDELPMVYFWTANVTGDHSKLHNPSYSDGDYHDFSDLFDRFVRGMSTNEYIIEFLMRGYRSYNDVPIRFLWNKLSAEEKSKNIDILLHEHDNQDLRCSLLSSLDYDEQQVAFRECSRYILGDMLDDWLWGEYFLPTALHALDVIRPEDYGHVMNKVARKMSEVNRHCIKELTEDRVVHSAEKCANNKYKCIFRQLWQESPRHLKDDLKNKASSYLEELLTISLSWERDIDVVQLILSDLNA